MNALLFLLVAWFAIGVACAIGFLWYMKTHEKQLMDEIPAAQIFGCIPPPSKWAAILIVLFFGPAFLLWAIWLAIQDLRKQKEENVPAEPPITAAAPVVAPQSVWMVLFALFGAVLMAYGWANAYPAKPLATFLEDQARAIGFLVGIFVLAGALGRRKVLHSLLVPFNLLPLYLVDLAPPVTSMIVGWEGGWILGIAGAAAGAGAGAMMGWLFTHWTLPADAAHRPPGERARAILLPIAFAVLYAIFGVRNWGFVGGKPEDAWVIGVGWVLLALTGALVGRPVLGLLVMSPFVLVPLVPLVASMTVGWEGGWILGIAGAAVGAAAGAVNGWLFNRWIMPEYDKRRARESAVRPPDSTDGPGLSGSMAKR